MKAKITLAILLLELGMTSPAGAADNDLIAGVVGAAKYDAAAFRTFFAGTAPMTAFQVRDRFGMPHRYAPLEREDSAKKISPYRAIWIYELGPGEAIAITVDAAKVIGVLRHHGRQTEVIRDPERFAPKKPNQPPEGKR